MSKNSIYTYDYFQPEQYRFSLDSVFLAQKVAELLKVVPPKELLEYKILDLCAGCGIIGLELTLHLKALLKVDFLEVQEVYRPYFQKNVEMIYPEVGLEKLQFLQMNYRDLMNEKFHHQYDLIVSNPPYFLKNEGLLSPSEFKNRCRFFIDSDFKTLIEATLFCLKPKACAYLLVRSGTPHGRNPLNDIKMILGERASSQIIDQVRGTDIIEIRKHGL